MAVNFVRNSFKKIHLFTFEHSWGDKTVCLKKYGSQYYSNCCINGLRILWIDFGWSKNKRWFDNKKYTNKNKDDVDNICHYNGFLETRPCPFIQTLSRFYPSVIQIKSGYNLDKISIKWVTNLDLGRSRIKVFSNFIQILSRFYPDVFKN